MTNELDEGPDPADLRRHMKKMLTELEYRRKYRRVDFYRPNRKQLEFHNMEMPERMLRAGNQLGKTHSAAAQMTFDALALYPEWYAGRRFEKPPKIERPMDFLGWAACTTSLKTRDGAQTKLLGDLTQHDGLGTGLIPLDSIVGKPAMARGIANFVDSVSLKRENGGRAIIRFKTYEMGRDAFQGESCDEVWLDEDVKGEQNESIYGECQARLTTTNGIIIVTMTPVLGLTPIRRRFKQRLPGTAEVLMTLDDALVANGGHILDEAVPGLLAKYKASERQTRLYGADMQGEGAVFETPLEAIKYKQDPATFPPYWRWLWALDFRHSGSASTGHPFAAVLLCRDRDNDVIRVVDGFRMHGLAPLHVARIKQHPMWDAPVAWPHDGGRGASLISGETVAQVYKVLGLNMRPKHATFHTGGYDFEAGLTDMEQRLATRRLLVASHLVEVFDEYQGYHRVNGLVNKIDDDLLSAIRIGCMDIRFAKAVMEFPRFAAVRHASSGGLAAGVDFDLF
jgi:phage terminase large subunit-like protein